MGVQTLHAGGRPSDAAGRAGAGPPGRDHRVSLGRVAGVGGGHLGGIDGGSRRSDTAGGFEPGDRLRRRFADQPVPRRHRRAVMQERRVADDDRIAIAITHHHFIVTTRWSSQQHRHPIGVVVQQRSINGDGDAAGVAV